MGKTELYTNKVPKSFLGTHTCLKKKSNASIKSSTFFSSQGTDCVPKFYTAFLNLLDGVFGIRAAVDIHFMYNNILKLKQGQM